MDRELESKVDEISTAFERWAKEVADRIVEAAQQGAKTATQAREAIHKARDEEQQRRERDGDSDAEDPWADWAHMRNETWSRWASGKFDKPEDADAFRRAYRQAFEAWGELPLERLGREVLSQLERFLRSAGERNAESTTTRPEVRTVEVIGEFVDADVEPVKTKKKSKREVSKYAQSLIKKIEKLDRKNSPQKLVKALMVELEADLKKIKKKKKKDR